MFGAIKNLFGSKNDAPSIEYWQGDIGLTLMVYNNGLETHVQSEIRRYAYYFKVAPDLHLADLEKRLNQTMQEVYHQHRLHFQRAEPNDPNYIAIAEAGFRQLTAREITAKPWLSAQRPHWEQSHCLSLSAATFDKVDSATF
jgi:hypothetical protein